ncbi:hypothetical protein AGMMS49992_08980 [Clostridia bacterium]|nr:hypothetical protein AGMMS49992_08980 [Clostridia bacterium]
MRDFNINGLCMPNDHYMVDLSQRVREIAETLVEKGKYFTINRARQYGKTTTLNSLAQLLSNKYIVIRLSFEGRDEYFSSPQTLALGVSLDIAGRLRKVDEKLAAVFRTPIDPELPLRDLGYKIQTACEQASKGLILLIDEVDKASDNQIFIAFLGLLRDLYLERNQGTGESFKSVILAGVYDVKNLKLKIRPDEKHTYNSPWNIAAPFYLDMSFSADEIAGMLGEYEEDYHTGMSIQDVAEHIRWYTDGYPFLVSLLCKHIHDAAKGWTIDDVDVAARRVLVEKNTLFDDMIKNLVNHPKFSNLVERIVLEGKSVTYNPDDPSLDLGIIYGIFSHNDGKIRIANQIFSTRLMNYYISISETSKLAETRSYDELTQFIKGGVLDFDKILERFTVFMRDEYRDSDSKFLEREARRLLLGFIKPIINGTGNYFLEPEIRGGQKIDILVLYRGQEYIIEVKIWRGKAYENSGVDQLARYARARHREKGYLVSFCDQAKAPREGRVFNHNGIEIHEVIVAYKDVV